MVRKVGLLSIGLSLLVLASSYGRIQQQANRKTTNTNQPKDHFAIPPRFDHAGRFHDGLAAVQQDNHWGYINPRGEWEIEPQFTAARPFRESRAAVRVNGQWGFIKPDGRWLVPPQYDEARSFSEGYAPVRKNDRWTYLDKDGSLLKDFRYDRVHPFRNGRAVVERNERKGFIDRNGNWVIDPQYRDARSFSHQKAPVKTEKGWGYINRKGEFIVAPQYQWADPLVDTRTRILDEGEWHIWNADSKRSREIDASFVSRPDSRGFVRFERNGNVGFLDREGHQRIKPKFSQALSFTDSDYTPAKHDELWGYINRSGNWVIKSQFRAAGPFSDGLAPVKVGNHWGYIPRPTGTSDHQNGALYTDKPDTGLQAVRPEDLKTSLGEQFPPWRHPGRNRYVRILSTPYDHWIREKHAPNTNHGKPNAKYEVTRYPYREPTYLQLEAAEQLFWQSLKSAREQGWFSPRVGINDGYGLDGKRGVDNHFFKKEHFRDDRSLVTSEPEALIYHDSENRSPRLGGMMYYPEGTDETGPQIGGPLTIWHYHIFDDPVCHKGNMVQPFRTNCSNGTRRKRSPEMIHTWFLNHPSGPFGTQTELKNLPGRPFSLVYKSIP